MSTKKTTAKKTSTKKETSKKDPLEELESEETPKEEVQDQTGAEESKDSGAKGDVSAKARIHQPTVKTEQNPEPEPQPEPAQEEAPTPIVEQPKTFPASQQKVNIGLEYQRKKHEMKEILEKQPKVAFMIPRQEGDGDNAFDTVQINGFRIEIRKGVMVQIPQQVAELLADKYRIHAEAGNQFRLNRDDKVQDALS